MTFQCLEQDGAILIFQEHLYQFPIRWLKMLCSGMGLVMLEATTSARLTKSMTRHAWHVKAVSKIPIRYVRGAVGLLSSQAGVVKEKVECYGVSSTVIFTKPL